MALTVFSFRNLLSVLLSTEPIGKWSRWRLTNSFIFTVVLHLLLRLGAGSSPCRSLCLRHHSARSAADTPAAGPPGTTALRSAYPQAEARWGTALEAVVLLLKGGSRAGGTGAGTVRTGGREGPAAATWQQVAAPHRGWGAGLPRSWDGHRAWRGFWWTDQRAHRPPRLRLQLGHVP